MCYIDVNKNAVLAKCIVLTISKLNVFSLCLFECYLYLYNDLVIDLDYISVVGLENE